MTCALWTAVRPDGTYFQEWNDLNRPLFLRRSVKRWAPAPTRGNERGAWRDGECQAVGIDSPPPLSSTDGAASIFCLFCHANVLKMMGGGVGGAPDQK